METRSGRRLLIVRRGVATGGPAELPENVSNRLYGMHWVAWLLHAIIGLFALVWVIVYSDQGYWWIRLFTYEEVAFSTMFQLAMITPWFSILSMTAHMYTIKRWKLYTQAIANDLPWTARWYEYAVSASVMIWVIATLSGADTLDVLLCLVVLNVCLQMTGLISEYRLREIGRGRLFLLGSLIHCTIWAVVFMHFFYAVSTAERSVPIIVYAIAPVMFFLHSLFGAVNLLHIYDKWSRPSVETGYTALSFIAKATLSLMIIFGAMREKDE